MRLAYGIAPALLVVLAAPPAEAQDAGRYRMERSADGFVRMDTETGAMSRCEERDGQLVCRMAADERAAADSEIERLRKEVEDLGARVAKLENSLAARLESNLPTEEEFDRTIGYMERFLRSFFGIAKEMEKDRSADPGKPLPQRT